MPKLPHNPQPLDVLRARYHAALVQVFDLRKMIAGEQPLPGECPANVFDFQDGLRVIVSREDLLGRRFLHFSASLASGAPVYEDYKRRRLTREQGLTELATMAAARFRELSGDAREFTFDGFTPIGTPNWHLLES